MLISVKILCLNKAFSFLLMVHFVKFLNMQFCTLLDQVPSAGRIQCWFTTSWTFRRCFSHCRMRPMSMEDLERMRTCPILPWDRVLSLQAHPTKTIYPQRCPPFTLVLVVNIPILLPLSCDRTATEFSRNQYTSTEDHPSIYGVYHLLADYPMSRW